MEEHGQAEGFIELLDLSMQLFVHLLNWSDDDNHMAYYEESTKQCF